MSYLTTICQLYVLLTNNFRQSLFCTLQTIRFTWQFFFQIWITVHFQFCTQKYTRFTQIDLLKLKIPKLQFCKHAKLDILRTIYLTLLIFVVILSHVVHQQLNCKLPKCFRHLSKSMHHNLWSIFVKCSFELCTKA